MELYRKILLYSKSIREATGDIRCIHGEIYEDMVFGALLSAIDDEKSKKALLDTAFKNFRNEHPMCVSLEKEDIAENAMYMAEKRGITHAIIELLGLSEDVFEEIDTVAEKYINEIKQQY